MKIIITILCLLVSFNACAMSGNDLYEQMKKSPHSDAIYYIQGAMDSHTHRLLLDEVLAQYEKRTLVKTTYVCFPKGATYGQGFDIVKNYLEVNPATRNELATNLIYYAFIGVWRCPAE